MSDDDRPWGFISGAAWVELPKAPMLRAELGPPPFDVVLPDGSVRRIVHRPESDSA